MEYCHVFGAFIMGARSLKLRVHLCGADTDTDMVWKKHVENIGPVSTCADTDRATHPAPHTAVLERILQSSCLAKLNLPYG